MIEKLSKEQEAKFPEYVKKWTEIGLKTGVIGKTKQKSVCEQTEKAYKIGGLKSPKLIFFVRSPLEMMMLGYFFYKGDAADNVRARVADKIMDKVWDNIGNNVGNKIVYNVWDNVWSNVRANVRDNVRDNVVDNVRDNVVDNVRDNVGANVGDNVRANVGDSVGANFKKFCQFQNINWGQYDSNIFSFYDFFGKECGIKKCFDLSPLSKIAKNINISLFYTNVVIHCFRPIELHLNARKQMHNEKGLAIKYSDGWGFYMLNGVRIPKEYEYIVTTPAEKINPADFAKIENVEVRREFVRKVGLERILKHLKSKIIHTMGDYDLLELDLNLDRPAKALKMINPSIGIPHVEFVPFDIVTCEQALNFRNGLTEYIAPEKIS